MSRAGTGATEAERSLGRTKRSESPTVNPFGSTSSVPGSPQEPHANKRRLGKWGAQGHLGTQVLPTEANSNPMRLASRNPRSGRRGEDPDTTGRCLGIWKPARRALLTTHAKPPSGHAPP